MLFVIDIGNTNTVLGIYEGDFLVHSWRIRTQRNITEDEFHILIKNLLNSYNIDINNISNTIVSCVVPHVMEIIDSFCRKYLGHPPKWIDSNCVSMPILYTNPAEVGADRIVNAVAAYEKYKNSLIIIDFGTATTFDCISENGEYLGGAISPGIKISAEALFEKASKLPKVEIFNPPKNVIGKDTANSMKSGIIFGYAGLVDGIVERICKEMNKTPLVIATGGLAQLMSGVSKTIEKVEEDLTLDGLFLISKYL